LVKLFVNLEANSANSRPCQVCNNCVDL
jgi:hypothetical protein